MGIKKTAKSFFKHRLIQNNLNEKDMYWVRQQGGAGMVSLLGKNKIQGL